MNKYIFRETSEWDIEKIVEIYNSNPLFLQHHLGCTQIKESFVCHEMTEMKQMGFLSTVIQDRETKEVIGVLDYKADETVYLSLLMLHKSFQGNGTGSLVYHAFEQQMCKGKKNIIRIDVVNDYVGNVVPFWEGKGFERKEEIELTWGNKCSKAVVMCKKI